MTDPSAEMTEVLTELLRLYDWRAKLAVQEHEAVRAYPESKHKLMTKAVDKLLRQYGREKAAARERARAILSAIPESGWISVKDALPPEGEEVLAIIPLRMAPDDGDPWEKFCYEVGYYGLHEPGKWALDGRSDGSKVTHWMPLPLPPVSQPSTTEKES